MNNATSDSLRNIRLQRGIAITSAALLIVKFVAWSLTHSVAVLTDALESIVNVVAGFIGLYSLHVSAQPRDENHPYGHGKVEFISAAVEGTLVLAAGTVIFYAAVKNLIFPQPLRKVDTGIWLVAATAIVNWILGYIALQQGKKTGSVALAASGRHLQSDTWSTVGIILGLVLIQVTGLLWLDAAVALGFGAFIVYTGYQIVRRSVAGIMDEADMELLGKMVRVLNASRRDAWVDLHNLRVIKYGNMLHLDCHLTVPWYFTVQQAHEEVDELAAIVRQEYGETLELFVHSDGCKFFQCSLCEKKACPVRQHPFAARLEWTAANILQNQRHGWSEASNEAADTAGAAR